MIRRGFTAVVAGVLGALVAGAGVAALDGPDPAAVATPAATAPVVDYAGEPLPGATLCLVDDTGGFPVVEAAAAYADYVEITIGDCADALNVAVARTVVRPAEGWSGWYNAPDDDDDVALISLNLAQAYRLDPHEWRMTLVHEIGHAVGLTHTHEADSVMDPAAYATHDDLTDTDRRQLAELYPTTSP